MTDNLGLSYKAAFARWQNSSKPLWH